MSKLNIVALRWKAETPKFFKGVINAGISLGIAGGAILAMPEITAKIGVTLTFPSFLLTIGGYMVAAGSVASVVGKMAVENPEDIA